jgi:hypothetical protein
MNNLHPIMARALNPFIPPRPLRVFTVSISGRDPLNVLAPSSMAAISRAIELQFSDDDECPAEGISITCKPGAQS